MNRRRQPPFAVLVDPSSYRRVAALWAARNFVAGGAGAALLAASILLLYGAPPGFRTALLFALAAVLTVGGLLIPRLFRRSLSAGMMVSGAVTAVAVACFAAAVGRHLAAPVCQAVVMVAASAPILYARRWAICILLGVLVTCGLVLGTEPHSTAAAARVILLVVQTALYAVLMVWFSGTLWTLVGRERQARAENEATRAELMVVDERRRNFLHQMSHELRTPLNAIIGFAEMVQLGMAGRIDDKQQEYLEPITTSGRHLLALVDDVLDMGLVEGGQLELVVSPFPVGRVVRESVGLCRDQAERHGIALSVDLPVQDEVILADERKVRQILLNLLSNALKFTPRGGGVRLELAGRRDGVDGVEVKVSDTGPGVDPADRERIFRAYEQAGTGAAGSGTGLGLAVARELAEVHGGRLELAEKGERGATFVLRLPRRAEVPGSAGGGRRDGARERAPGGGEDPGILDEGSALERLRGPRGLARDRARIVGVTVLAETAGMAALYVLPRAERFQLPGWPWLGPVLLAFGLGLLHPRATLSPRTLFAMTLGAVAVVAWYVWEVGADLSSSMATILVMEGLAAFTFFRLRRALIVGVEIALAYGYVAWFEPGIDFRLIRWLLTVSMVASGALLARWLLGYLPGLVESENRARRETEMVIRQLEAASRHKSEFLAAMSHELRTPLNAIIGYADALGEGIFGPMEERAAEYLRDVAAAGRHLLMLINDILDLAKADAGHLQISTQPTSVSSVLAAAAGAARERAARSGIDFQVTEPGSPAEVDADPARLARAVACILDNAVAFTPSGGTVQLTAAGREGGVRITVMDSGPGIDPADHERIFAPFESGAGPSGSGIGLALARRFVELHGGTLTVESRRGEGSRFSIDLPRSAASDQLDSASVISSPTSGDR